MKPLRIVNSLIVFTILPVIFLTGCWNSREINTLAITICTGIDKTENGYLVTQQILNPKAIALQKSVLETPVILYSEEGKDIFEIYRRMTTECPRKIYNSHLRMVIFGEALARDGIQDVLDLFTRDHEFRTDFYFAIAKGTTANKVLSILTPLEAVPGMELFDSLKISEAVWAPTKATRIIELVNSIIADGINPVLPGIEIISGAADSNSIDVNKRTNEIKRLKYTGMGAFKEDKLVGWLDENEGKGYSYIVGNVKNTVGYVNYSDNVKITYEVKNVKSKISASMVDGKPEISVEMYVNANVGAVEGQFDVSKPENRAILTELPEKMIEKRCRNIISKMQEEYKTDIFGFGEAISRRYPEVWEEIKNDWSEEFSDIPVTVTVAVKINQLGQITKPFFIKEK